MENEKGHHERAKKSAKQDKDAIERQIGMIRSEYETKIAMLSQEIQKLNHSIKITIDSHEKHSVLFNF